VDYKTVQHHVRILEENGLVSLVNKGSYGAVLFLTAKMEEALPILDEIWSRIGTRKISATAKEKIEKNCPLHCGLALSSHSRTSQ